MLGASRKVGPFLFRNPLHRAAASEGAFIFTHQPEAFGERVPLLGNADDTFPPTTKGDDAALDWIALVVGVFCWLALFKIGTGISGHIGPQNEYPIEGRVVGGSPFGRLVRLFRGRGQNDPASGIVVFGRAHFAGESAGPYLVCHELGHLYWAMILGRFRHTFRYVTEPEKAKEEEAWCHQFALDHQSDGLVRILYERMAAAEQKRTGSVTKVDG